MTADELSVSIDHYKLHLSTRKIRKSLTPNSNSLQSDRSDRTWELGQAGPGGEQQVPKYTHRCMRHWGYEESHMVLQVARMRGFDSPEDNSNGVEFKMAGPRY